MPTRKVWKHIDLERLNRTIAWRREVHEEVKVDGVRARYSGLRTVCPVCGGEDTEELAVIFNLPYRECRNCGHAFCGVAVDPDYISEIYSGETNYLREYADMDMYLRRVEEIAEPKVAYVASLCGERRGLWVDVGCGCGHTLYAAKRHGWTTLGIEPGFAAMETLPGLGIEIIDAFVDESNASTLIRNPDVLSFFGVLEHLEDPGAILRAVSGAIIPDTKVVIQVPRHPSLSSFCCVCMPDTTVRHMIPPQHLHIFSEESLGIVLEAAGLEIEHIWTFGQDFYELLSCVSMPNDIETSRWPRSLRGCVNDVQKVLDEHGLSDNMIVTATKKRDV